MARQSLATLLERPDRQSLIEDAETIIDANTPASEAELGRVMFGLLIMYPEFDRRSEQSKAMVVDQWRKSLSDWPIDILEEATQAWINGEKSAFVPQPGDVLKVCERIGAFRRAMAKKARDFLDMARP